MLASKGWPEVLYSFHSGWEENPNFFIVTVVNHLGLDAVSSPFLFQPFSLQLYFLCSLPFTSSSFVFIFLDFFSWFSISTKLEGSAAVCVCLPFVQLESWNFTFVWQWGSTFRLFPIFPGWFRLEGTLKMI